MSRSRCAKCHFLEQQCLCDLLPQVAQPIDLVVFQHVKEAKHAKNTIRLLQTVWPSLRVIELDEKLDKKIDRQEDLIAQWRLSDGWFLLYPGEDSQKIDQLTTTERKQIKGLVVIDGTWRKAFKLLCLYPELDQLPKLSFQQTKDSIYHIRKAPNEQALSSYEAIVYACQYTPDSLNQEQADLMLQFMDNAQQRLWLHRPTNDTFET